MQTKDLFKFHSFGKMLVFSCLLAGFSSCSDDETTGGALAAVRR